MGEGRPQAALGHDAAGRRTSTGPGHLRAGRRCSRNPTWIDAASAAPHPGTLPLLHRLSRTEYQNAVRDLLAIEALPKEMDYSLLLPADNISSGFDNIADLLFVSPTAMERYLDAARKICRLAVGDPDMPPMVNIHRLHPEQWQEARVDELPIGTRGGLAVRSYFPMDGDYVVKLDVANAGRDAHQIEITVDDERVQLATRRRSRPGWTGRRTGRGGRRRARRRRPAGIPHPGEGRATARRRHLHRAQPGAR